MATVIRPIGSSAQWTPVNLLITSALPELSRSMVKPYLRDLRADAAALLNQKGLWVVAGVEGGVAWPKVSQVVPFDGMDYILRPAGDDLMATIAFNAGLYGLNVMQGQARILKLATAMSWGDGGNELGQWQPSYWAWRPAYANCSRFHVGR
ncbi:hypothetical protein [Cupriavidus necator]|uniref:hypothetical protein n=1 Tax=Cupriavidus necator TaxID=106590 RepID=UPI00339D88AD